LYKNVVSKLATENIFFRTLQLQKHEENTIDTTNLTKKKNKLLVRELQRSNVID